MSAITVGGDLVHYEKLGRGKPVILMHGWIGSWRYWIPLMRQLQLKYAVYALDLFGYGDSGKNPMRYPINQQVEMLEIFMQEMMIPKAAFIAHGLGAMVTSVFAHRQPDKVARMLLISLPLFNPGGLDKRTPPGYRVRLNPPDPNVLKNIETRPEGSKNTSSHNDATLVRRPAGLDMYIGKANSPDQTVPSANNDTIVNPSNIIDREKLRQAAMERGTVALKNPLSPAPDQDDVHNPLKDIMAQGADTLLSKTFKRTEPDFEKIQVVNSRMDQRVLLHSSSNFDSGAMLDTLRQLPMPIVAVHGEDDPVIPPPDEDVWNYLTLDKDDTLLPVPLPGVRHFPMLEYEPFSRLVGGFLETPDISKLEIRERWRRRTR